MTSTLLTSLEREFRVIESMDPSIADGFRILYDREVPFELRAADCRDTADVGALEGIKVKIVAHGEENALTTLRFEVSSDADLFFHYTCVVNNVGFIQLREDQKLMCEFREFGLTVMKMFNRCIKEPKTFLAILLLQPNGEATLQLVQNMEYKFVELLSLPFRESSEATIRQHVSYRYNALRSRLAIMTAKLQDVSALVKIKNPVVAESLARGGTVGLDMAAYGGARQVQQHQQQQQAQAPPVYSATWLMSQQSYASPAAMSAQASRPTQTSAVSTPVAGVATVQPQKIMSATQFRLEQGRSVGTTMTPLTAPLQSTSAAGRAADSGKPPSAAAAGGTISGQHPLAPTNAPAPVSGGQ